MCRIPAAAHTPGYAALKKGGSRKGLPRTGQRRRPRRVTWLLKEEKERQGETRRRGGKRETDCQLIVSAVEELFLFGA